MKILLLQHKNKIAFLISFIIHTLLFISFLDFSIKANKPRDTTTLSLVFYTPNNEIKKEKMEENQEEIAKKSKEEIVKENVVNKEIKKTQKIKKNYVKKQKTFKDNTSEIKETKQEVKEEIKQASNEISKQDTPIQSTKLASNQDELIAHIQAVLSKSAKQNYPISSRKRREQDTIIASFTYDYGTVKDIKIIKASRYEKLNQAAIKSIKNAKFKKFERIINISVPLRFRLH